MPEKPLFSIITATYNAVAPLPGLLESLAAQSCSDFELVVQDGASQDDTLAVLERYRTELPALSTQSELDSGIYDAWNRAVARARGSWLLFLGADDSLASSDVLAKAKEMLMRQPSFVIFAAGSGRIVFPDGEVHAEFPVFLEKSGEYCEVGCPVAHPSLFYSRTLFAVDCFDTAFRVAADYDFLLRHWDISRIVALPFVVTDMRIGGISTTPATRWRTIKETLIIAKKHLGYYPRRLLNIAAKSLLHYGFNTVLGEKWGNRLYDMLRRLNGHGTYWSKHDVS